MADTDLHFAELESKVDPTGFTSDTHLVVKRVVVVGKDVPTANGPLGDNPKHVDGETWCQDFFKGGTWKQTFNDKSFRKNFAAISNVYDPVKDIFVYKQPFASFTLDENNEWQAPVTYPTITTYSNPQAGQDIVDENGVVVGTEPADKTYIIYWDEAGQKWKAQKDEDTILDWDSSGLTWIST